MSLLRDYMATYGSRLQSLLEPAGGMPPSVPPDQQAMSALETPAGGGNPALAMQLQQRAPEPASDLAAAAGPQQQPGRSFQDHWQATPPEQQKKAVDELEGALKRANETIDSAYDEMIRQLGARPNNKLSRLDKGMLLMEFGLSMMANSRPGVSAAEAAGVAGSKALGSYAQMTRGRQMEHDKQVRDINMQRAKSKSELAKTIASEGIKAKARGSELARVRGTVTTEGGELYGYTGGGTTVPLRDPESGEILRGRERPEPEPALVPVLDDSGTEVWMRRSDAVGKRKRPPSNLTAATANALQGLKPSDSNTIYRQAAGLFGGTFDPITKTISGLNREQTLLVQKIAARAGEIFRNQPPEERNHAMDVYLAFEEIAQNKNPQSGQQNLPRPTSQAEYDALPSGTVFIAPDGSRRQKP